MQNYYTDSGTAQHWETWRRDDDADAYFCEYDENFFSPAQPKWSGIYECTKIRCTMDRLLDTEDVKDWKIVIGDGQTTDTLTVAQFQGFIQFN